MYITVFILIEHTFPAWGLDGVTSGVATKGTRGGFCRGGSLVTSLSFRVAA